MRGIAITNHGICMTLWLLSVSIASLVHAFAFNFSNLMIYSNWVRFHFLQSTVSFLVVLKIFPSVTASPVWGSVLALPGHGCHQRAFDTASKGGFRHVHVNISFPRVAGKVFNNSMSEMGFAILEECWASLRG